jgi:AcrR family transcriptional regulator
MDLDKLSTKEKILKVANEYFSKYGYELTYLDDIAKECSITKPAIYYHFRDKASLYEEILVRHLSKLADLIEQNCNNDEPITDLQSYIFTFGHYLVEVPSFAAIFAREIANDAKTMPQDAIKELSRTLQKIKTILKDGNAKKIFEYKNPFMIQMMIVTTLCAYITTNNLRKRVASVLQKDNELNPYLPDVIENLSHNIIKALKC